MSLASSIFAAGLKAFGEAATYTPLAGAAVAVRVVFSNPFEAVSLGDGSMATSAPVADVKASDLPDGGGRIGASLAVGTATFRVVGVHPDGRGGVRLILEAE